LNKFKLTFLIIGCAWANVVVAQASFTYKITSTNIQVQIKSGNNIPQITVYRGYLSRNQLEKHNPIIGKTSLEGTTLNFKPLVPFSKILKYTLALDDDLHYFELGLENNYNFIGVKNIYPDNKDWPANILKFHILFDKPVSITNVYDHIYFLDAEGNQLSRILLDLGQAITDSEQKSLTIWIEPGRQKRDLGPNQILGTPFEVGKAYKLIIEPSIKDKNGIPMRQPFSKDLIISDPVRTMPDPSNWNIILPENNKIQPLTIDTKTAYDFKSVQAHVFITYDLKVIKGILRYSDQTNTITFLPNLPWTKGIYKIHVNGIIEDLAGNTPQRLFDTDLHTKEVNQSKDEFIIEFKIE
jgi:hypothetical protein